MADVLRAHQSAVEIPAYLPVKYAAIKAGLFSCSQQGFNIAMGPLARLQRRIADRLSGLVPAAVPWDIPLLIRADWIEPGVWRDPHPGQWCTEQPAGHVLTPQPLMHLLNRLRHHPASDGTWRLTGHCIRNEDPDTTLPLLRQRSFTMVEFVRLANGMAVEQWAEALVDSCWHLAAGLDLPVELIELPADGAAGSGGQAIRLKLPEVEPVSLLRSWRAGPDLLGAYRLGGKQAAVIGCGVERLSLGILARWGLEETAWPDLEPGPGCCIH